MQTIKQILVIVFASAIVMALFMPLAQTDWAENMQNGFGVEGEGIGKEGGEGPEKMREMPVAVGFVAGFIKEIVVMGIPALITLGVIKLIRGRTKSKIPQTA